jgi:hypothetical protein
VDWQEPAHSKFGSLYDYNVHANQASGLPLNLNILHLHSEAVDAATTPMEHAKVNIRLAPSIIFNDNPPLSTDRLLASIVADLFSCCNNIRSLVIPNKWVDVFVEAGELLFPLVDWTKQQALPEFGRT